MKRPSIEVYKPFTLQLGTSGTDIAHGVTVDSPDNIYVTGNTEG
ncbi:uncharacterized protein METZ01_LOCUS205234 [marine metagenome]|uniref:SMP-30/Gluconolactonase/LRE-like region domain-containing protein n=1 Tax=marine metagenome TaxID=408172 RepID=A0A382ENT6_9ZZZZ